MSYQQWIAELAELFEATPEQLEAEITSLYYLWKNNTSVREAYDVIKHQGVS